MVSFNVVSEYSGGPEPGSRVKIPGGPLYSLERVQGMAKRPGCLLLWTGKCRRDVANLAWDDGDLAEVFSCLKAADYKDSEWCDNGKGAWAACDAYTLRRSEWVEAAGRQMTIGYFLKFAVGKTGALVLMVSCHA